MFRWHRLLGRALFFVAVCCISIPWPAVHAAGSSDGKATEAEVTSPSGRAEVVVPGVSKKAVLDALVERMTESGYTIGSVSEYKAVFEKPGGFWANALMGSEFNRSTVWRVTFSVFDTSGSVKVKTDIGLITNPGSGFEQVQDMNKKKNHKKIQAALNLLRDQLVVDGGAAGAAATRDTLRSGSADTVSSAGLVDSTSSAPSAP